MPDIAVGTMDPGGIRELCVSRVNAPIVNRLPPSLPTPVHLTCNVAQKHLGFDYYRRLWFQAVQPDKVARANAGLAYLAVSRGHASRESLDFALRAIAAAEKSCGESREVLSRRIALSATEGDLMLAWGLAGIAGLGSARADVVSLVRGARVRGDVRLVSELERLLGTEPP